jgi:hypothetical protein
MQYWTVEEIGRHAMADHEPETEIAPRVTVHRRTILSFGVFGAAALSAGTSKWASGGPQEGGSAEFQIDRARESKHAGDLTVAELVNQLHPKARELISAGCPNESDYLAAVQKLLSRITLGEPWAMHNTGKGWSMETNCWLPPIVLFRIRMEPGASMNLHDHRHYNGVLLCTKGEVRCRNFEYVQADGKTLEVASGEVPPAGKDFLIRLTRDDRLRPRSLSALTRDRDNLHTLVAGEEGCELVDFFTHFRPEARSYDLDWDDQPCDKKRSLYRASWKSDEAE